MKITDENGPVLTEMLLINSTLEGLDFSRNAEVSDAGAVFIAEGLKRNNSLKELILRDCCIGDQGILSLGHGLAVNTTLRKLQLMSNRITGYGAKVFAGC